MIFMKRIEAVFRAEKKWDVTDALTNNGVPYTVFQVEGIGKQLGEKDVGENYFKFSTLPKAMVVCYVEDDSVDSVKKIIADAARTGKRGDGIIVASDVSEAQRIRTGENL